MITPNIDIRNSIQLETIINTTVDSMEIDTFPFHLSENLSNDDITDMVIDFEPVITASNEDLPVLLTEENKGIDYDQMLYEDVMAHHDQLLSTPSVSTEPIPLPEK